MPVVCPVIRPQIFLLLFCVYIGLLLTCESCVPVSEDATILMQFKESVLDPLDHLSSWASPINCSTAAASTDPARSNSSCGAYNNSSQRNHQLPAWQGVTCGPLHGRVTVLNLPSMSLAGSIPGAAIGRLKFLRVLNLSSNNFHGSFPRDLANCTHLQKLDLSENAKLEGSIPREWGRLSRLQELTVVRTTLSGSIPKELANCSELVFLVLGENQLSSRIPAELGALSKLQILNLYSSPGLTGTIPATLANCSVLIELDLLVDGLSGSIPAVLGTLPALQMLKLFGNFLTGDIPAALSNCSLLIVIQLGENELSGHIPAELGSLKGLTNLSLQNNYLRGYIPATLGNCSALQKMSLAGNGLSGSIPSELGRLPLFTILNLFSNNFTGEVPSSMISNFTNMVVLDISFNKLNGTLDFLEELKTSSLFFLHIGGNLFSSQIPDIFDRFIALQALGLNALTAAAPQPLPRSLRSLQSLAYLFLDASNFQGSIPSDLVTSPQMIQLYLSSNNLSGAIPGSVGGLSGLGVLDMSHNFLTGKVPTELGSLLQLQYLNLSTNKLSGRLPAALANCAQLISLNLSANQLTGSLPLLPNMPNLAIMDLSYNYFTGPIPDAEPYNNISSTITILLEGNPDLCGRLVHRQCSNQATYNHSHRSTRAVKRIAIVLSITILLAVLLILATIGFFQLRKRSLPSQLTPVQHPHGIHLINASVTELREATGDFNADHILGTGAVSTVYRAVLSTGKAIAVKVFNNETALADEVAFRKEVAILAKLRHRNIVRVCGCCYKVDFKAILLELMPNGSLDQHLNGYESSCSNYLPQQQQQQHLTGLQKLRILKGVAEGLQYLHHHHPDGPIVHCDLKPHNILLDASFEACITDFGIAKMLKEAGSSESASLLLRGSIGYIPPEYGYEADVSTKGDVYSYGVVMLEVLTCKSPTCVELARGGQTYLSWVKQNYFYDGLTSTLKIEGLLANTGSKLLTIAMLCTQESPFNRPTMLDTCLMMLDLCHGEEAKSNVT